MSWVLLRAVRQRWSMLSLGVRYFFGLIDWNEYYDIRLEAVQNPPDIQCKCRDSLAVGHHVGCPNTVNCHTCGRGRRSWGLGPTCPGCEGNPILGTGRSDWKSLSRAKMVARFGPRLDGDVELLAAYPEAMKYGSAKR
jgi:hypothetical protein